MRYQFKLIVGDSELPYHSWSDDVVFEVEKEEGMKFHRKKLGGKLVLSRELFWAVANAEFETEFVLMVEEYEKDVFNRWTVKVDEWKGVFYRTDCDMDFESESLEVQPNPDDRYRKVMEGLDTEFDLMKLRPLSSKVRYKKLPLVQVYLPGSNIVANYLGNQYWETEVSERVFDEETLIDEYKFKLGYDKVIVTGEQPYSGLYDGHTRLKEDGNYVIINDPLIPSFWYIRNKSTGQNEAFSGSIAQEGLFGVPEHAINDRVFGFGQFGSKAFRVRGFVRVLMDEELSGVEELPEIDIGGELGYKYVLGVESDSFILSSEGQDDVEIYGTFAEDAAFNANKYFVAQSGAFPVMRSSWRDCAIWFQYDSVINDLIERGASEIDNVDTYKINNVVNLLVRQLDDSVIHSKGAKWSQFLYSLVNPVSVGSEGVLSMTPITNITIGGYDQPATKALVTMREVFNMLRDVYNNYWMIDEDGNLVIEHEIWFENGGSYDSKLVGTDLTALIEPKTEKFWGFGTKKYKWDKFQMPERLTWKWQNNVSDIFEGFDILVKSVYVQKGNKVDRTLSKFTSDLDFVQAHTGDIAKEGFMLLMVTETLIGGSSSVPFVEVSQGGNSWTVQNGGLSLVYLHDKFWRHGLPARMVELNEEEVEAESIMRHRVQELDFPASDIIDPLRLIRSSLGEGQVDKLVINLANESVKATIKHDTED